MDTKKTRYGYGAIIVGFLLFVLIIVLYLPVTRTSDAASGRAKSRNTKSNTSVSSFLDRIIGEPNKIAAEPNKIIAKPEEPVAEPPKIIEKPDLPAETIWYAGTWDSTLYDNARFPKTVAIRMKLLDKESHLPIPDAGVSLKGEYMHQWATNDAHDQIDLSIFHDLKSLPRQRRRFGMDAISDSNGFVVFSLNCHKEYSWKDGAQDKKSQTEGDRAAIRAGDIECTATSQIRHSDYKNVEIPVDFKRMVDLKPVVLDLGEKFPDFKNKQSHRVEFFETIRARDNRIAYGDVKKSPTFENKTKCGPYLVYDLGEVLLERTAPQRTVRRPDSTPSKTTVETRQPRPSQQTKPPTPTAVPKDQTSPAIATKTQAPKESPKTAEQKDQIPPERKPDAKNVEQPEPVAQTAPVNVSMPVLYQADLKEKIINLGDGVTIRLVLIPEGQFQMGSAPTEIGRDSDEGPVYNVRIDQPFYMSVYEVTQEQYEKVLGMNPSKFTGPKYPVHMASWNDAQIFCQSLSSLVGERFRLPTEAEWEYACRAGTVTPFYWGYGYDGRYAWSLDNSRGALHEVGTRLPNAWGLYDMSGNLWEWCEDSYDEYPSTSDELMIPEKSSDKDRILRGGSWNTKPVFSRSANRSRNMPHVRMDYNGFRVVLDVK